MTSSELRITSAPDNRIIEVSTTGRRLRLVRYLVGKGILLFITVIIGLYLTILVVNLGGYVDEIFKGLIRESIGAMVQNGWLKDVPEPERTQTIQQTIWDMEDARGLHKPFLLRTGNLLIQSLTFDLGRSSINMGNFFLEGTTREIILYRIPYTLALIGISNMLFFIISVIVALFISRKPNNWLNRLIVLLTPVSSAPSWVYGVLLIFIFAVQLHIVPFPRAFNVKPTELSLRYASLMLLQLILPTIAVFLSVFFQGVYSWRTFFLMYSREDYVDLARAKGLPDAQIERRYILRPSLPYVVTSFALMAIGLWQGSIPLEKLFYWPGIGALYISAVGTMNTEMILSIVVVFAYLLAITIFLLDIIYALLDPRIGSHQNELRAKLARPKFRMPSFIRAKQPGIKPVSNFHPNGIQVSPEKDKIPLFGILQTAQQIVNDLKSALNEIARFPSAIFGITVICLLIVLSICTVFALPYNQTVRFWRGQGGDWYQNNWSYNPVNALPEWVNFFRRKPLPKTIILDSRSTSVNKVSRVASEDMTQISIPFTFNYSSEEFPNEIILYFENQYTEKLPFINLTWQTPDGRKIDLGSFSTKEHTAYYLSEDEKLLRKLGGRSVIKALFTNPAANPAAALRGSYQLKVDAFVFEKDADVNLKAVVFGQVYGLAGTDSNRRDLTIPMMWGLLVALSFGILGAICTGLVAMTLAALGVWYSGWVDNLIQRATEINMILPTLPIIILISAFYTKSIWGILGIIVILNIFGNSIKSYRAAFLQIKEAPYIEAAQSYGTSNGRMIGRYLMPHILPVLVPQLIISVPTYVFIEATLAFLGISDPYLPTWGKVIFEGVRTNALYQGNYYQLLEPIGWLITTSLAFALLGFALERILNPGLREG